MATDYDSLSDSISSSICPSPLSSKSSTNDDDEEISLLSLLPMAWDGKDLNFKDYVIELSDCEISAINEALKYFKNTGVPTEKVAPLNFPLPRELASRLETIGRNLYYGTGVTVLRGINPAIYDDFEKVVLFAGVSSYVCSQRATDSFAGITLSHVRDATYDRVPEAAKGVGLVGSKLPSALAFHADRFAGDILTLFVVNQGADVGGGEQFVSSFWRIYLELKEIAPEVIETLEAKTWPWQTVEPTTGEPAVHYAPAMFYAKENPVIQLVYAPLLGTPQLPRPKHLPSLSPAQYHALEMVEKLAKRFSLKLDRRDGDIQFVNNLSIMHARTGYKGNKKSDRHLLRMFLRDKENAWKWDEEYKESFDKGFRPELEQEFVVRDLDPWFKIEGLADHG